MLLFFIGILICLNIWVVVHMLSYVRYFTYMFHQCEFSNSQKMSYREFLKFMKKK